jgi:hypothetical protein
MKDHIKLGETWRNISLESNVKNIMTQLILFTIMKKITKVMVYLKG